MFTCRLRLVDRITHHALIHTPRMSDRAINLVNRQIKVSILRDLKTIKFLLSVVCFSVRRRMS